MPTALEHRARRVLATLTVMALTAGLSLVGVLAPAQAADDAPDPVVTVLPSGPLDPASENVLTVSGTGFVGEGAANGAYVLVGPASAWVAGPPPSGAVWLDQKHVPASAFVDGAFSVTFTVPAGTFSADTAYMVATSAAHGLSFTNRSLDTRTPIAIAQPEPEVPVDPETPVDPEVPVDPETPVVTPAVTVTPSSALDPSVTNVLTVSGTGFAGPGAANGAYVLFGEASAWPTGTPLPGAGWVSQGFVPAPQIRDGAFSTTVTIPAGTLDPSKTYVVATSAAHGLALTDRTMDTRTPVTVKQGTPTTPVEPEVPVDPEVPVPPVDPETPVTPETPVARGTLTWGVKESFRSYIVGPIASGSISVADGATRSGSLFAFPQSSSDVDGTTGTAGYSGSVRFTGHSGALDLTLSNPSVRLTSASTATLVVDAQGISLEGAPIDLTAVDLADLALPASTSSDGVTTWTSAPATLTAAGAEAFSGFYQAGDAIDPVTFTVGASTGTPTEPGTPGTPGEPGLEQPGVVAPFAPGVYANAVASVTAVVAGGEVTFTGQGFGSGTEGIEAAIYSERQLLASGITADAAGQASATVTIPADLTPGVHTLSLESPEGVMSQVQITVEAPVVPTAAQQCVARSVSGATLSWGVKESFRTYITGPIAKGAITPSGVTSSGSSLGWSSGSGKFNTDVDQGRVSFPGSVSFSGHGGILDLTISNVRVQVNSASTGSLIADVASSDMEGTKNQQSGVTIASLNLTGTKSTTGGTVTWTGASASLTSAGASAFGGFYTAGDAMDPVTFAFPLGAEVECDVTSGANGAGALATTGADASVTTGLAAFLTLLAGVGAVALARRQRRTV